MGGDPEKTRPIANGLEAPPDVEILKITEPPVDDLLRLCRCGPGKIPSLHQPHLESGQGRDPRHGSSMNAATHDEYVAGGLVP